MMNKLRICCLAAMLFLLALSASAVEMIHEDYTDVPSVMTQDAVLDLLATTGEPEEECGVTLQEPDEKSMALLEEIYDFVWRDQNRPVRYYDEETQKKIQELVPGVDIDALHMTEFMAQEMYGVPTEEVMIERLLDVDYRPGQLVVVVLGYEQENGEYRWFPYRGRVPATGLIRYIIPEEEYRELAEQPQVIYHVLTNRIGARGKVIPHKEVLTARLVTPSIRVIDLVKIRRWYTSTGVPVEDNFRIYPVEKTEEMLREIDRISRFLEEDEENAVIDWFPEEIADQAQLLLGDAKKEDAVAYDIIAVMADEYKDTYGDVATENVFASVYSPEREMVVLLGFPLDEEALAGLSPEELDRVTHFEWYCLRAESVEEIVEIVFKQLVIPQMETEPAVLVVLSEPMEETAEDSEYAE